MSTLKQSRSAALPVMEFAWLPSVPLGAVTATYRIGDEAHQTTGVGYHDHNWGNASLQKLVHDWYWARGQAGPYSVIASIVTAHERYGYTELPLFMLARDGALVADDSRRVRFEALDTYTDGLTGKPVATRTRYTYLGDDEERWVITFTRERDVVKSRMIESVHGQSECSQSSRGSTVPTCASPERSRSNIAVAPS